MKYILFNFAHMHVWKVIHSFFKEYVTTPTHERPCFSIMNLFNSTWSQSSVEQLKEHDWQKYKN